MSPNRLGTVGDGDGAEGLRPDDHRHGHGVDEHELQVEAVLLRLFLEDLPLHAIVLRDDVGLVHQGDLGVPSVERVPAGVVREPCDGGPGQEANLEGEVVVVRRGRVYVNVQTVELPVNVDVGFRASAVRTEEPVGPHVEVLGVLPQEMDVEGDLPLERDQREPGCDGTEVDVLVEDRPHLQQDALLQDAGLYPGVADRPEVDRVLPLQGGDVLVGEELARPQVPVRPYVEELGVVLEG